MVTMDDVAQYRARAAHGDAAAQLQLGLCYKRGLGGVPADASAAVAWFRKAAALGSADAHVQLGACYENGAGAPRDDRQAAAHYQQAADAGHAEAMNNLACLYESGRVPPPKPDAAATLYKAAARLGSRAAQANYYRLQSEGARAGEVVCVCNLAYCHKHGWGVPASYAEAAELYLQAARKGDTVATLNLAWQFEHGHGVARDLARAVRLYRWAAEAGGTTGESAAAAEVDRLAAACNIAAWTTETVRAFLQGHGFAAFADGIAQAAEFDGRMLLEVTDADLRTEFGMPFVERKRFLSLVRERERAYAASMEPAVARVALERVGVVGVSVDVTELGEVVGRVAVDEMTRQTVEFAAQRVFSLFGAND